MSVSYIPLRDGDLNLWGINFDTLITAGPSVFGLQPADAVFIHGYVSAFTTALQTAINPSTRTPASVAEKDGAKAAMLDIVRLYAQQIRLNHGVADVDKIALGITVTDAIRTPIPAPSTYPVVQVVGATFLAHTLRYNDQNTPDSRAKPFGALGLQLFVAIGDAPASSPEQADFQVFVTHQPFEVTFQPGQGGKYATYFSRWQTATGLVGPWPAPVSLMIVG